MLAPSSPTDSRALNTAAPGSVTGNVRLLLRLEGVAAFAAAVAFYAQAGFSWPAFALFFLAPDLAMLAYLVGPRAGAIAYNLAHTYVLAAALTLAGFFGGVPALAAAGLIWIAHFGFDRALGYGLKYSSGLATLISAASADAETRACAQRR